MLYAVEKETKRQEEIKLPISDADISKENIIEKKPKEEESKVMKTKEEHKLLQARENVQRDDGNRNTSTVTHETKISPQDRSKKRIRSSLQSDELANLRQDKMAFL